MPATWPMICGWGCQCVPCTTTSAASLEVSAFRNSDGSVAVVALNSANTAQVATFSLRGLTGAQVTPYLTDTSHDLSAQAPITVRNGAFVASLPRFFGASSVGTALRGIVLHLIHQANAV